MGHLINPIAVRLSINIFWNSNWTILNNFNYVTLFKKDYTLFKYLDSFVSAKKFGKSNIVFSNYKIYRIHEKIFINFFYYNASLEELGFNQYSLYFLRIIKKFCWHVNMIKGRALSANNKHNKRLKSILFYLKKKKLTLKTIIFIIKKLVKNIKFRRKVYSFIWKPKYKRILLKKKLLKLKLKKNVNAKIFSAVKKYTYNSFEKIIQFKLFTNSFKKNYKFFLNKKYQLCKYGFLLKKFKVVYTLFSISRFDRIKNVYSFFLKDIISRIHWLYLKRFMVLLLKVLVKKLNIFYFNIFILKLSNITPQIISMYMCLRLQRRYSLNFTLKPVLKDLSKRVLLGQIRGFKILCAGRFTRKEIATYTWSKKGVLQFNKFSSLVKYYENRVRLKFGLCGIKIWINSTLHNNRSLKFKKKILLTGFSFLPFKYVYKKNSILLFLNYWIYKYLRILFLKWIYFNFFVIYIKIKIISLLKSLLFKTYKYYNIAKQYIFLFKLLQYKILIEITSLKKKNMYSLAKN